MGAEKDPIARAKQYMKTLGIWSEAYEEQVWEEARTRINLATTAAEKRPEPDWASMFDDVYAEMPPALARQRDELLEKESGFERQHEGEFPL